MLVLAQGCLHLKYKLDNYRAEDSESYKSPRVEKCWHQGINLICQWERAVSWWVYFFVPQCACGNAFFICPFLTGNNDISILSSIKENKRCSYSYAASTGTCLRFQLVIRYVGCSLVATFGEKREWDCFPTTFWEPKHDRRSRGLSILPCSWRRPHLTKVIPNTEAGSCICHGQQMGIRQTCKFSTGASKIDRQIDAAFPFAHNFCFGFPC